MTDCNKDYYTNVKKYFKIKDAAKEAQCIYCEDTVSFNVTELNSHIKEKHSVIYDGMSLDFPTDIASKTVAEMNTEVEIDPDTEIDPDLFLKCRLCIEETGAFQIHRLLQDQIRFCFEINVRHADCLSQLVCKKCKNIVTSFCETKTKFTQNQTLLLRRLNSLRQKAEPKLASEENNVTETTPATLLIENHSVNNSEAKDKTLITKGDSSLSDDENVIITKKTKKRKKLIVSSSSSSSSEEERENTSQVSNVKESISWRQSYKRKVVCRFCNSSFLTKNGVLKHMKSHRKLVKTYKKLVRKHCKVQMEKIEEIPNLTGQTDTVVINLNNILQDDGNINYFIKFVPSVSVTDATMSFYEKKWTTSKSIVYESSDAETRAPKNKKIRLQSRTSSNETVVISEKGKDSEMEENMQNKNGLKNNSLFVSEDLSHIQCINLDDSSNDSTSTQHMGDTEEKDLKIIQEIIAGCYKKQICNLNNEAQFNKGKKGFDMNMLNSKLLSTGTKILSSNGVGLSDSSLCGLLKYLQHKNLTIQWISSFVQSNTNKSKIRISAKIDTNISKSLSGWSALLGNRDMKKCDPEETTHAVSKLCMPAVSETEDAPRNDTLVSVEDARESPKDQKNLTPSIPKTKKNRGETVLQQLLESDNILKNKILNASPVANPKQLPKKNAIHNVGIYAKDINFEEQSNRNESINIESEDEQGEEIGTILHLPIITSTTSLANENLNESLINIENHLNEPSKTSLANENLNESLKNIENHLNEPPTSNNPVEKPIPRLKCKPVSELLARPLLVNSVNDNVEQSQAEQATEAMQVTHNNSDCEINRGSITMNSVDLPNTSSLHPIEYFKTLLQMHGINLLTTVNVKLTKDFVNLVKFRLEVSQFQNSAILGIALFGSNSTFCLKLGTSKEEMDIDTLPPHWQMRVLKSFRGQVSQKILHCAQKTNLQFYGNVRQFVLLLENIEFKSDEN